MEEKKNLIKVAFNLHDSVQNTGYTNEIDEDYTAYGTDLYIMVDEFRKFLLACGFSVKSVDKIQIVENDDCEVQE